MQTEDFKTKIFSNIVGPPLGTDEDELRKYYEDRINLANIPGKTLRKIYAELRDPCDSHLAMLSNRRSELGKELVAARVKAHREETATSWHSSNKLVHLAFIVVLPVLLLLLLSLEVSRAILAVETPGFSFLIGLVFLLLPAAVLAYILYRYSSWHFTQKEEVQNYLREIDYITQKYRAAEQEYRNLTVMLEVIGNACRDEHEQPRAA